MGTTTISLKDEAYRRLRDAKRDDESFSDVVIRLTDSAKTEERIEELAGGLGTEFAGEVEASSADVRESLEMGSGE
jgi:predicted CopG family antitoxin